jgi:hypothetical protein
MSVLPDPGMGTRQSAQFVPGSTFLPWADQYNDFSASQQEQLYKLRDAIRSANIGKRGYLGQADDPQESTKDTVALARLDLDKEKEAYREANPRTGSAPKQNDLQSAILAARAQDVLPPGADMLPESAQVPNIPMVPDDQLQNFHGRTTDFSIEDPTAFGPGNMGPTEHYLLRGADPNSQGTAQQMLAAAHPTRATSNAQEQISERTHSAQMLDLAKQGKQDFSRCRSGD